MLKVKKSLLKKAVNVLEKFDNRAGMFPQERFFRLTLREGNLLLEKSDFMNDLIIRLKADVRGAAKEWREGVCLQPDVFEEIFRSLPKKPDSEVEITLNNSFLLIDGRHTLSYKSGSEFPEIPGERIESWSSIQQDLIKDLTFAATATHNDEELLILNGICIGEDIVATDGRRIHCVRGHGFSEKNIVIPRDYINLLLKLNPVGGVIGIGESGRFYAEKGNWILIGTPLGGDDNAYPDYRRFLDGEYEYIFEVSRPDFLSALKEASAYTLDYASQGTTLRMSFDPGKNRIQLEMHSDTIGNFKHVFPVKTLQASGDSPLVGINIYYLIEAISGFQGSSLFLHVNDNKQYIQITGREPGKLAIIMPVRLEEES